MASKEMPTKLSIVASGGGRELTNFHHSFLIKSLVISDKAFLFLGFFVIFRPT